MKLTQTALIVGTATLVSLTLPVQPVQANSLYECSGIGMEGREAAKQVPHTLRLVVARPDGHYLGNVEARVSDRSGSEVVSARCPGSWVLLDLPGGTYEVSASFGAQTKTRTVTVSSGTPQEQIFVF